MNRKFTLKPRRPSPRDYSHRRTFGLAAAALPKDLRFTSTILDQGESPRCTAYASVGTRDSMKGKLYDPSAQWTEELQMMGVTDAEGSDVQTAMATGVEKGFVPVDATQSQDNASAYYWLHSSRSTDLFDTIRQTINQIQAPVMAGVTWFEEWNTESGIVPHLFKQALGGHCIKIAGFTNIDGKDYLIVQNSWGTEAGDQGLFYFDRYMANRIFGAYGVSYWSDDPSPQVKRLGLIQALYQNLLNLLKRLSP